jgi:hypothetical protein
MMIISKFKGKARPVARDGSNFGPELKVNGFFTIGEKCKEVKFEQFKDALAYLQTMNTPKWRRPNIHGRRGIVSGISWQLIE